jgi:hypothetical protein
MARSSAASLQLVTEQFQTATSGWRRIAGELQQAFDLPDDDLLRERPASTFILTWMREAKSFNKTFSSLFGRIKQPPLADDFTAAVALCLEQFLAARGHSGRVRCEETTHKKREAIRPDVSVRSTADELIASIECKINFAWKRKEWQVQYETRKATLLKHFPNCSPFLCVFTQDNWDSVQFIDSPDYGKMWFCLSKVAVGKITDPINDICHPGIEPMFLTILGLLEA